MSATGRHGSRPGLLDACARVYRAALLLYPGRFRQLHGEALVDTLTEAARAAHARGGARRLAARFLADLVDLLSQGLAERWSPGGGAGRCPTPGPPRRRDDRPPHRAPLPPPPPIRSPDPRSLMGDLLREFRRAARTLARKPTFSLVTIVTLGLAIGATTTIFTVVDRVLLDPMPYDEPSRLVALNEEHAETGLAGVSTANLRDWEEQSRLLESTGIYQYWSYTWTGGDEPMDVPAARVTPDLFATLGTEAVVGRGFGAGDGVFGNEPVALLGHGFWERAFGADPGVIGRRVELDAAPHTVVGVMPEGFDFPPEQGTDIWTALTFDPENVHASRNVRSNLVLGRLREDATVDELQQELDGIAARLEEAYGENRGWGVRVRPAREVLVAGPAASNAILLLFGAVGFLLLIACANVTNLMLARLGSRDREIAVRVALGAGRLRLAGPFLAESLLLAGLGGLAGVGVALGGTAWVRALPSLPIGRLQGLEVDAGVLLFAALLSLALGLAFGLLPLGRARRTRPAEGLRQAGGSMGTARGRAALDALVVAEVGLALVLLVGAGLMVASFVRLSSVDPGFESEGVLAANLFIPDALYPEDHEQVRFFEELLASLRSLGGVSAVGAVSALPLDYVGIDFSLPFEIVGQEVEDRSVRPRAAFRTATPGYFDVLGLTLLRGRFLEEADHAGAPKVVVINETMARRHFPDGEAVGEFLRIPFGGYDAHEVVGVVGDLRHYGLGRDPQPEMITAFAQHPLGGMVVVAATPGDPRDLIPGFQQRLWEVDPRQPVYAFNTMDELVAASVSFPRLQTLLFGAFAAVALLLAAVGIYGVMSYAVSQRTRELGLRMALGADVGDTRLLVLRRGLLLIGAGVVLGLVGAASVSRLLQGLLYGIDPLDPVIFGGVALLLALVATVASWVPARRATRVDPIIALRADTE